MKFMFKVIGITLLTIGLLAACSSNSDELDNQTGDDTEDAGTMTNNDEGNESDGEEVDTEASDSTKPFDDQMDLGLGDTGKFTDTLGSYEVKVNTAANHGELDGHTTDLNYFAVLNITVKNLGEDSVSPIEVVKAFQLTNDLEFSGYGEVSDVYEFTSIQGFPDYIDSGEEVTGDAVFEAYGEGDQHLQITPGLLSAGAVDNQVIITIKEENFE